MRLAFEVADGTSFKLEGHVVRADRLRDGMHRYGLEFAELDLGTEQRMFKAVFEQEQVNVGRHEHVRMTVWEPVTCTLDGEPHGFPAHALQLSADDVQVITRRSLPTGERIRVAMDDAGLGFRVDAEAEVADVQQDGRGCPHRDARVRRPRPRDAIEHPAPRDGAGAPRARRRVKKRCQAPIFTRNNGVRPQCCG